MPIVRTRSFVATTLLAASGAWSVPLSAQTVDDVIAKMIEARGGLAAIQAVQTRREIGRIAFGTDAGPFMMEQKRPAFVRMELRLPTFSLLRLYDGEHGWTRDLRDSTAAPVAMSGDDLRNIAAEGDFDGPFVNGAAKGYRIAFAGRSEVEGKPMIRLRVTFADGRVDHYDIDARTYVPLHWEGERVAQGKPVVYESFFREYLRAGGVMYPSRVESDTKGTAQHQTLTIDSIAINPPIADERFVRPR